MASRPLLLRHGVSSGRFALSAILASLPVLAASTGCLTIPEDLETPTGTAAAPSSAQELLDRHISASGGAEALGALSQRTVEARVVFKAQEGCEAGAQDCIWEDTEGQFVLYSTADGRMYRRMVVGDNVLERGFDGETGWQLQQEPQLLMLEDPSATPILREDALLHWYFDVAERSDLALELLPTRTIQSEQGVRELDGVRWFAASETSPESEKWFDRSTGLLYEELERDTETGDLVRRIYSDYRDVDGAQVAWQIDQITEVEGLPAQVVELHLQVVHHRDVREDMFAVPELGPTEPAQDVLLANLRAAKSDAEAAPKELEPQVRWARAAFQAAHFGEAAIAAKAALKLDAKEIEAQYILARVSLLQGKLKDADTKLRGAVKNGLRTDEAARQLAWIHLRQGQWQKAGADLAAAGFPVIGERYAAFEGKPLQASMKGCVTTLPFVEGVDDVIILEIKADDATLRMLFDTGASDLLMSDQQAHSLVIGTDAMAPLAAGGPNLPQGQLESLGLGDMTVKNVPVTMFPADQLGAVVGMTGVDGVIGIRPFAGRQLTVDREKRELEIVDTSRKCAKQQKANQVGAEVPFYVHETHYIYLRGEMNGAEGVYLLNTGMRGADLTANEGAYAHAGIGAPPMQAGVPTLAGIERFALGEYTRTNLGAAWGFLYQNATSDMFRLDGMLGLEVLGRGRWTLDYSTQTLFIQAPPEPAPEKAKAEAAPAKKPEAAPAK